MWFPEVRRCDYYEFEDGNEKENANEDVDEWDGWFGFVRE